MTAPQLTVSWQGLGVASADQLNTYEQTCDNFAQLRGFVGLPGMQVAVRGQLSPGDGGGGIFYWDSTAVGPDNNETIVMPAGVTIGAWVILGFLNPSGVTYSYQQPANAFAITIPPLTGTLVLDPAGTLASGVVTFPAAAFDGQNIVVCSTRAITALSLTPGVGQTIANPVTTLAAGGSCGYKYVAQTAHWYRVQ